ncbi:hypothetical protein E2562_020593 [Oryza meyeriana var. granulata]|uniref:Uncharacterized protein n=1 Tax=Oryza meyeriana var. granulata TaxID=110450 RepID=A0A6G1DYA0_9ORYZ|nr:hypothetical protein E2562_020593 [Oryza meyeriana var. granulata]
MADTEWFCANVLLHGCLCGASRWKNTDGRKKIPQKVLRHFPLIPRLKRMFASKKIAEEAQLHKLKRKPVENELSHPADGEAWKEFDRKYEWFAKDARNIRLGLATDGFNPFGKMSSSYSMWPDKCIKNQLNREKIQFQQRTGSRCYLAYAYVMKKEKYKDTEPTAIDLFKDTHFSKKIGFSEPIKNAISTTKISERCAVTAQVQDLQAQLETEKQESAGLREEVGDLNEQIVNLKKAQHNTEQLIRQMINFNQSQVAP